MIMKFKTNLSNINIYYLLVSFIFLFPRGYAEYSEMYHRIMSVSVWAAVGLILIVEAKRIVNSIQRKQIDYYLIMNYFFAAIVITVAVRNDLSSGLQQLFAMPVFCVFLLNNLKRKPKQLMNSLTTVFIINFTLNLFLTKMFFEPGSHIVFLGHVQMICQYGLAALLVSMLYYITYGDKRKKNIYLIAITFCNMLTTDADSALFASLIIIAAFVIYKLKLYSLFCLNTKIYIGGMVLLSLAVIYLTAANRNIIYGLDFSGRRFVWEDAIRKIHQKFFWGYGIDGVLLHTFWTDINDGGFNYAHNQILQNMLDGGLFLTIVFWIMITRFVKSTDKLPHGKYRVIANATFIALLFVMIFDSTTLYSYMYIILAVIYNIPMICNKKKHI